MAFSFQLPIVFIITSVIATCLAAPTTVRVTSSPDAATTSSLADVMNTYRAILSEMYELRRGQKATYDDYKVDRFGDSDINVPPMNIAGIPDLSGVTAFDRFAMNESSLLQFHRCYLQAFRDLMYLVRIDEAQSHSPTDFGANFSIIAARLNRVGAMIEEVMRYQGYFQDGFPTTSTVSMAPNDNEMVRNIRDLYVLQELYSYLSIANNDLYNWYGRHQNDLATQ